MLQREIFLIFCEGWEISDRRWRHIPGGHCLHYRKHKYIQLKYVESLPHEALKGRFSPLNFADF